MDDKELRDAEMYWYGMAKAGDKEAEYREMVEAFNKSFQTIGDAIRRGVENIMIQSARAVLQRQIEHYVLQRELLANAGGIVFDSRIIKYHDLGELITAYEIVREDLREISEAYALAGGTL